jgi:hypothetical protein
VAILPVVILRTVSGSGIALYHQVNWRNSNTKHQTNIDWDRFLDILEVSMGKNLVILRYFFEYWQYLLHMVCLYGALEGCRLYLDVSLPDCPNKKCGMNLEATPLHLACFAGCSTAVEKLPES